MKNIINKTELPKYLKIHTQPKAKKESICSFKNARFTILTSRLIRCEWSNNTEFEDYPSQNFFFRNLPVVEFSNSINKNQLTLETKYCLLKYVNDGRPFHKNNLSVSLKKENTIWHFGDKDELNLGGTARTLDNCDGSFNYVENKELELTNGLMSTAGYSIIDDSNTLVFPTNDIPQLRQNPNNIDCYLFAYGKDYAICLKDYYKIAGNVPLLPKWALGIWWSKWEAFTQEKLKTIVNEFEQHKVPLSVCVIDMDWHLPGWTGYSWNSECFPNPKEFFEFLHKKGVYACLNLHPADGVAKHETNYANFAKYMGINPKEETKIEFDITNSKFINGYFKYLHHPLQEDGVDFWWIDWQQGLKSNIAELDPLWMLNHFHSLDLHQNQDKRPFVFSRWCNYGAHRYPIGFSGDASRTWKTLSYQVEFTAKSANIGFGWWSHDIGGFSNGFPDDELYVRWLQFGAVSPILRLHNCGDPTLDYRPWEKEKIYCEAALKALSFRHSLLPYIYTCAWANSQGDLPICTPMYYSHPNDKESYVCSGQYYFGKDLISAPITEKADKDINISRKVVWLPKGNWFDFFTGEQYKGGRWHSVYKNLNEQILFAKAGSIIPLNTEDNKIDLIVFPGNGTQRIYLDDGKTMQYKNGNFELIKIKQKYSKNKTQISITTNSKINNIILRGLDQEIQKTYNKQKSISFNLNSDYKNKNSLSKIQQILYKMNINSHAIRRLESCFNDIEKNIQTIAPYLIEFTDSQIIAFVEILTVSGFHYQKISNDKDLLCYWNPQKRNDFSLKISRAAWCEYFEEGSKNNIEGDTIIINAKDAVRGWLARIDYCGLLTKSIKNDKTGREELTKK